MNNLTEESGLGDCLLCFSKIENYDVLAGEKSQKIVDNCWNYLHENIANSKSPIIKSKNENELPLCKKCFDTSSELMELSELVTKSNKQILNLSCEFSLGVLHRRTKVESVKNLSDGQNSPKEFIVLDVSGISPSLFSTDQPNPTKIDDFAHPCEDNFIGMDVEASDPQYIFEIVKHESKEAVDDESAESEDDINITKDEELPAYTRPVMVLKELEEATVSEKFNSESSPQQTSNPSSLKRRLRNGTSKKKVEQSSSSNIIGKIDSGNVEKAKKPVSSRKVPGRADALNVLRISPSLFIAGQPNPTKIDDFAHPCEDSFIGMDTALNDPQYIFEIVKHESKEAVDDESAESEDDTNITKDEELPAAYTRPVMVLKELKEATVSEKFNSESSPQQTSDPCSLKRRLRNGTSKKMVEQPSSSTIIRGETGSGNVKEVKKSASSRKLRRRIDKVVKKDHKCHVCEKAFTCPSNLNTHIRIHTGEKPFKCPLCGKAFTQKGSVKTHVKIHTGENRFKCSHCTKTFVRSKSLKKHLLVHGE